MSTKIIISYGIPLLISLKTKFKFINFLLRTISNINRYLIKYKIKLQNKCSHNYIEEYNGHKNMYRCTICDNKTDYNGLKSKI